MTKKKSRDKEEGRIFRWRKIFKISPNGGKLIYGTGTTSFPFFLRSKLVL